MKSLKVLVIVLGLLLIAIGSVNTVEIVSDLQDIKVLPENFNPYQKQYDEMLYPTVKITTLQGTGSGVVIQSSKVPRLKGSKELYVLTAAHVAGNNTSVTVTVYSYCHQDTKSQSSLSLCASVVMTDTNKDLALLKFNLSNPHNPRLYTARLAPKNYTPYLFTPVYAVGCSLGLDPRPSSGIISAIHLSGLCVSAVEITAPILPGNSGGPVFSADTHEVIGIAVWVKIYRGQLVTTMGGVVPITEIYKFLNSATKTLSH